MSETGWRQQARNWLRAVSKMCLYVLPKPLPRTRGYWWALGLVSLAALIFCLYFCLYLVIGHNAFYTNAEDLGIMDQSVWSILHTLLPHMTICNSVLESNCVSYDGVVRFAIHVEPILYPISLFYLIWPNPGMLLIVQVVVVASGAFPAFWLARLRLRSNVAGVIVALVYLLSPALLRAVLFDFHAVTLTASFLLFLLYFLYTRRPIGIIIFALLAMACKEEIALVVIGFGLWSIVFLRLWRSGLVLIVVGAVWLFVLFRVIIPHASPTGAPILISYYTRLGTPQGFIVQMLLHPAALFKYYIWERAHRAYLLFLLVPLCFLPLFAPWVLVLALPSLALNLLSSNPLMYSGYFHYSAELVPVLIFAAIEGLLSVLWIGRKVGRLLKWTQSKLVYSRARQVVIYGLILAMLCGVLGIDYRSNIALPLSSHYQWPTITTHNSNFASVASLIPPDASISAQNKLVAHLSERTHIYLFPYQDERAEYIVLDTTTDLYPMTPLQYRSEMEKIAQSQLYRLILSKDGYQVWRRVVPFGT